MSAVTKDEIDQTVEGDTVPSRFAKTVADNPDRVALRWRTDDDGWGEWTWQDYADRACAIAGGLRALGLEQGQRVLLMMRNRPEFHVIDMGVLLCGGTAISVYNSSAPEQVEYLAKHCEATIAIVEDVSYLERFLKVREQLPALQRLVVLDDPDGQAPDDVVAFADVENGDPVDLTEAAAIAAPDDLVTMIYTSGTTGPPKGVMLSHYNVVFTGEGYLRLIGRDPLGLRAISYLPMAHIAERMSSHYLGVLGGLEVTTCPDTGQLSKYLTDVRPQTFFGVPRIWEKLYAGVNAVLSADEEKGRQFNEAVEAAKPIAAARSVGEVSVEQQKTWEFLDGAAFKQVREQLGLDQAEMAVSGAAPIPADVLEWFRAIGVPLSEIYGMSESTGPITWDPERVKIGTVGRAFPGCEIKLLDDGEVVCRGGNVFRGYLNEEEKTKEALDDDGWLHTGDIGELDDEGYLRIVDRKKELIITAGGKNISPANIEAALKSFPLVGQAAVIGDKRPFISALLVLDPEVAPAWAKKHGISSSSLADLAANEEVKAELDKNVKEANQQFNSVEQVKKFAVLGDEWLPDSDELTPTMKLKRRGINEKYAEEIEALYSR